MRVCSPLGHAVCAHAIAARLALAVALAAAPIAADAQTSRPAAAPAGSVLYADDCAGPLAEIQTAAAGGDATLLVRDSAYVAVFELRPGEGARLLSPPAVAAARRLTPGPAAFGLAAAWAREAYAPAPGSGTTVASDAPRYVYLLASRRPLSRAAAAGTPDALLRAVGRIAYYGTDPAALATVLRQALAPDAERAQLLAFRSGGGVAVAPPQALDLTMSATTERCR